jgi:RND family efflux transporter MFP subunit
MDDGLRPARTAGRLSALLLALAGGALLAAFAFSPRSTAEPARPADARVEIASRPPPRLDPVESFELPAPAPRDERAAGFESDFIDCMIQPSQLVDVGSPVIGLIQRIDAQRSDVVRRDQVLFELESAAERAAVELARARAEMDGDEQARAAKLRLGSHKEKRARQLWESDVLSLDLREESETAAALARFELQQAREERRLASLQLVQAEELLRRRTVRSPVDGVVVERLMEPGERVDEEVVLRVARIDPLRVEVTLPAALFGKVRSGMKASVEPELASEQVYVASVATVDRVIDAASGTFDAHLELPNPAHALPSGQHCRVRFTEP